MTELPRKAAARTARLAALPLGFAGRNAIGLGKRLGGKPAEAVMLEIQQRTAEQLFRTLGELKGGAMKFGQAMSVLEAALPDELTGPYRDQLTRLQDSAPPMPTQLVRDALERDLGADWRERLVWLDGGPTAAASIGQVHRGRWHDGRDVAVKVQYPGSRSGRWSGSSRRGSRRSWTTPSRRTPSAPSRRRSATTPRSSSPTWWRSADPCSSPSGWRVPPPWPR
jgi:predicted unusual protein kinase regulating ubiquinone biosynthesis (AarF/ABC1/UbiB family)